jgi:hypothetical protein
MPVAIATSADFRITDHVKHSSEALIGIQVNEGTFGDTDLSGVKVVLAVKWPKAIHEGNGAAAVFIDESASEDQVTSIATAKPGGCLGSCWRQL